MAVTGEQGTTRTPTAQMLEPLRRLVQDVSTAENLEEALPLVVHQVRGALDVDACSVFLRRSNAALEKHFRRTTVQSRYARPSGRRA